MSKYDAKGSIARAVLSGVDDHWIAQIELLHLTGQASELQRDTVVFTFVHKTMGLEVPIRFYRSLLENNAWVDGWVKYAQRELQLKKQYLSWELR